MPRLSSTLLILCSAACIPAGEGGPGGPPLQGAAITQEQLPEAARAALAQQLAVATVERVVMEERDGQRTFVAIVTRGPVRTELRLAEDGRLLRARAERVPSLEELPEAARAVVKERLAGGRLTEVREESREGRKLWRVRLEQAGRREDLRLAEDGTLLEVRSERRAAEGSAVDTAGLPEPLRQALAARQAEGRLVVLKEEVKDGERSFEAEFEGGTEVELDAAGAVLDEKKKGRKEEKPKAGRRGPPEPATVPGSAEKETTF